VDVLIEAIAQRVRAGERPVKIIIAGDGADRKKLMQLARDRRLNGHVQFLGTVNGNLKKYLFQNCRFVVMPSRTEGLPLVAIEAFSCGKPLLASSVGGLKDLLENRADLGLLVPPEEPRLLAQTLKRMEIEADGFPRDSIRNFARQFNWPTVGQAYLDVYGKLIGKS